MNRLYGDRGIQDSQLSLSVAGELHFELEDVVAVLFLEVQRFAMKFRIENRRRRVRLVGGLWLLQVPVRVDIDVAGGRFPGNLVTGLQPDGANYLVLELRLPCARKLLLGFGVLARQRQTGQQEHRGKQESAHGADRCKSMAVCRIRHSGGFVAEDPCGSVTRCERRDHQPAAREAGSIALVNKILLTINQIQLDLAIVFHHP